RERAHAPRVVAIVVDRAAGRGRNLDETEAADPARLELHQAAADIHPLEHALRIVEPIDPDTEAVIARQVEALADRPLRVRDALRRLELRRRPLGRDRLPGPGRLSAR